MIFGDFPSCSVQIKRKVYVEPRSFAPICRIALSHVQSDLLQLVQTLVQKHEKYLSMPYCSSKKSGKNLAVRQERSIHLCYPEVTAVNRSLPSGSHFADRARLNPLTVPACKISGLKSAHIHACKPYMRWSYSKSTFNILHFDRNPLRF